MADYTVKQIDDMEAAFRGAFKRVRGELGVEAFGIQVLELPPNLEQFPEHDHAESGQEEVYAVMRGDGAVEVDGERVELNPETIIRVGPGAKRKIFTGPEGMRVLAIGGVPGRAYEPTELGKLGAPDPMAQPSG